MANPQTASTEERQRELALNQDARQQRDAPDAFSTNLGSATGAGGNVAALRMAQYGLNDTEQQAAGRENLRRTRSVQALSQNVGRTAQVAGTAMEAGGTAVQGAGKATEYASRGVEAAGRGITAGGQALMRAGAGLSGTGVGAIAGVPLAIVGGAVAGAGAVTQGAGKVAGAVGQGVEAGGRATRGAGREVRQLGGQVRQASSLMPNGAAAGEKGNLPEAVRHPSLVLTRETPMAALARNTAKANALVGKVMPGAAEQIANIFQDVVELVGTSVTVVGLLYAIPKLHHRLIWGNFLKGVYLPAKPLAAPVFWAAIALLIDTILGVALMFLLFLYYAITNPCEIFAYVILPDTFSFLRSTMQAACPDKLLQNITQ